ncbi:hypothetical protein ACFQ3R_09835 [Mesonia ostreae]|uniref:Uncharacterized protein n=1 Tax=Mesonia ostreae TaxID=861110 RepID=A0ABU2KEB1_9FLAO|nr:hypothetical protein [Mesonia ostreae]MDT0293034.1 hypothetical protein [Mesonia ostreae]
MGCYSIGEIPGNSYHSRLLPYHLSPCPEGSGSFQGLKLFSLISLFKISNEIKDYEMLNWIQHDKIREGDAELNSA